MGYGQKLLYSLVHSKKGLDKFSSLGINEQLFKGPAEVEAYEFAMRHVMNYGTLPKLQTFAEHDIDLDKAVEPPEFYFDKCRERYVFHELRDTLLTVENDLNNDKSRDALEKLQSTMGLCQLFLHKNRMVNFAADSHDLLNKEYQLQLKGGPENGMFFEWESLNELTGGLYAGDVIVMVGRPGAGKTYMMLSAALTAWKRGGVPLFISMEMKPIAILQRLAAMYACKPITQLRKGRLGNKSQTNLFDVLKKMNVNSVDHPFWVVDGSLATTIDEAVLLT